MTTSDERKNPPPPDPAEPEHAGSAARHLVERLLKKGIETGVGAFSKSEDTVHRVLEGLKVPKEMAGVVFEQIDETKNGVYRAVAKEIRDFLHSTNFASEMKKIITGLAFEVKMEVRFKGTEGPDGEVTLRPDVTADVGIRDRAAERDRKKKRGE